jgi:peptidyl-prolyl cis-trans isomerase C
MNQPSAVDLKRQLQELSEAIEAIEARENSAPATEPEVAPRAKRNQRKTSARLKPDEGVDGGEHDVEAGAVSAAEEPTPSDDPSGAVEHKLESAHEESVQTAGDDDDAGHDIADDVPDPTGAVMRRVRSLRPQTPRAKILAAALTVALVAAATSAILLGRSNSLGKGVAFQVSGHDVTVTQLDAEAATLSALYGITAPTGAAALATFRQDVAKADAVSLIIDKQAISRNIVIADKSAQDVLTRYVTQVFGTASDGYDKFVQALGGVGTSEAAVLTEIKRQLAIGQLYDQITAKVSVTAAQVAADFEKNKAKLSVPEKRNISNIVVATQAQANQIRAELAAGTAFSSLAAKSSLDTSTSKAGGALGAVESSQLEASYAHVAFTAALGQPFGPVQTQYGWNVGEVTKIVPAASAVYSTIEATLKSQLLLAAQLEVWRAWLAKQIVAAHVRYASAYQPADPNSAPTTGPGQVSLPSAPSGGAPSTAGQATSTGNPPTLPSTPAP